MLDQDGYVLFPAITSFHEVLAVYPRVYSLAPLDNQGRMINVPAVRGDDPLIYPTYVALEPYWLRLWKRKQGNDLVRMP